MWECIRNKMRSIHSLEPILLNTPAIYIFARAVMPNEYFGYSFH